MPIPWTPLVVSHHLGNTCPVLVFSFSWDLGKGQPLWGLRSSLLLETTSFPMGGRASFGMSGALPLPNRLVLVLTKL